MKNMEQMQGKLLHIAWKLGISEELIGKMKDEFSEKWEKMEWEEKNMMDTESEMEEENKAPIEIDISKNVVARMPTEEDINKMEKEELVSFAMKAIKNKYNHENNDWWIANGQENSPFVVMMKKRGF